MIHVTNKAEIDAAIKEGKTPPAPVYAQVKRGSNVSATVVDKDGKPVVLAEEDILRGYKYGEDLYVTVSDEDKKSCMVGSDKQMTIESFVAASKVDPIYFEAAEYIAPDTTSEVFKSVFGLLRATMVDRGVVAIAKCNQRGREQTLILRPYGENGMTVHYMYFDNEVRSFDKWVNVNVTADQIVAAGQLIDAMTEPEFNAAKYEDGYMRTYRGLIKSRIDGTAAPVVTIPVAPVADKKMDVISLLLSSLASITTRKSNSAAA